MSQGGTDTAVVTADTSKPDPQKRVTNRICIIIGDMVKDGHNVEVTKEFLKHGYNVIILYSNTHETNEEKIGSWFENKILDIAQIDVKSSKHIREVFAALASKLATDEWSQFEVTVLIYNAALGLVNVVGNQSSNCKDDEKKENEKSGLTLKELAHCHDIGAHGFIHSVKEGLKFIDKESKLYFHVFYGKAASEKDSQLMRVINLACDHGNSLVNEKIENDSKKFSYVMEMPVNAREYLCLIMQAEFGDPWANVTMPCLISTEIGDADPTPYYLSTENVGTNYAISLTDRQAMADGWSIGVNNEGTDQYSLHYCIAGTRNTDTMSLTIDADGSVKCNVTGVQTNNEKWTIEPILTLNDGSGAFEFAKQFRLVNYGRDAALSWTSTRGGYIASSTNSKQSAPIWKFTTM